MLYSFLYFACLSVCLFPINLKIAEPIGPNFIFKFNDNHILLKANFWNFDHQETCLKSCEVAYKNLRQISPMFNVYFINIHFLLVSFLVVFLNQNILILPCVIHSNPACIKSATLRTVKEMEDDYQANVLSKKGLRWDFV